MCVNIHTPTTGNGSVIKSNYLHNVFCVTSIITVFNYLCNLYAKHVKSCVHVSSVSV